MPLWTSDDAGTADTVQDFLADADAAYDEQLVAVDVLGSIAHSQMLHEQGYLTGEELAALHKALLAVYEDGVAIAAEQEDVHTAVEEAVTAQTAAGKKLHTGRSRNDQIATDLRLYAKQELVALAEDTLALVNALLDKADAHDDVVMPGYTHLQQAMPTTAAVWLESHAAALLDDLQRLEHAYEMNDASPLGAAAGYGTTLDLDTERTADLLGFDTDLDNPTHAVASRGPAAFDVVQACAQLMQTLDTLAADLLLYSTAEYGFLTLPEQYCTGSSIMPQKQNPDVLELVQGKTALVQGHAQQVQAALQGTGSGYTRSVQVTKQPFMDALATAQSSVSVLAGLVDGIALDEAAIADATQGSITAAHTANSLVDEEIPFREAYRTVKEENDHAPLDEDEVSAPRLDTGLVDDATTAWEDKAEEVAHMKESLLALAEDNAHGG